MDLDRRHCMLIFALIFYGLGCAVEAMYVRSHGNTPEANQRAMGMRWGVVVGLILLSVVIFFVVGVIGLLIDVGRRGGM